MRGKCERSQDLCKIEENKRNQANEGNEKNSKYLHFSFQTLNDDRGYWLDTCEFNLKC